MKHISLLLIGAFFIQHVLTQTPCYNVSFGSQAQIDSFPINYPQCTGLGGYNMISGDDIVNLEGLSNLTFVDGGLLIEQCDNLTSLSGLDNLQWVGTLSQLYEGLGIHNNVRLKNLNGLTNLTTIEGALQISGNDSLKSLSGLENLTSIGDGLFIWYNQSLKTLAALTNLTTVGMDGITIEDNPVLTSLNGLQNIDGASVEYLKIRWNDALSYCHAESICDYLLSPNGTTEIYSNTVGCNSVEEIEDVCWVGLKESDASVSLNIHPNPSEIGTITLTTGLPEGMLYLSCFNTFGEVLVHQEIHSKETNLRVGEWPPGIYLAIVYEDGKPVGSGKFVIR